MIFKVKCHGYTEVKYFNIQELFLYDILTDDDFINYFEKYLDLPDGNIENWGFCTTNNSSGYEVDLRKVLNKNTAIIDWRECELELCDVDSYEYNVAMMGLNLSGNIYLERIWIMLENQYGVSRLPGD